MLKSYREAGTRECASIINSNIVYVLRDVKNPDHPLCKMRLPGFQHRWYVAELEQWMETGKRLDFIPDRLKKYAKQEARNE